MSHATTPPPDVNDLSPDDHGNDSPVSPEQIRDASDERGRAILVSAATLITELGWERFTMRRVADSAGVSLSTIYASWPTKIDLALAAVMSVARQHDGSFRGTAQLLTERSNLILCLLSIQRSHPAYRTIIRDMFREPFLTPIRERIVAAADHRLPDQTVDLIALVGPAIFLARSLFLDEELSQAEVGAIEELTAVLVAAADPDHELRFTNDLNQDGGRAHRKGSTS